MRGLAIDLVKPVSEREFDTMVRKANKRFKQMKLDGVRYKGKLTVQTWDQYQVYN